ncbi:hypothetical protein Taro_029474, partial [Colocasia esculenta]|nr:hypothetical protein [Colocasia esculenta]
MFHDYARIIIHASLFFLFFADIAIYMFFSQHYKCSMLTVYDSLFPLHVDHPFPNQEVLVDEAKRSLFSGYPFDHIKIPAQSARIGLTRTIMVSGIAESRSGSA